MPELLQLESRDHWLRLPDGSQRFSKTWWSHAAPPQAVICIVPGLGEHVGRYAPLALRLLERGIGVVSMDLQGQGRSPGWRGCVHSYQSLLQDVVALVKLARGGEALSRIAIGDPWGNRDRAIDIADLPAEGELPVCLYGHSMGGNLVLNSALRGLVAPDRIIASAPMLRAVHPPGPLLIRIARILGYVLPNYRLKAPVRKEYLSHIRAETDAYEKDPLVHRRVSLRLGAGLIDSGLWAIAHADQLRQACLLMHGTEDQITDPSASKQFAERALSAGASCRLRLFDGMLHDLHRDEGRDQVIAEIANWTINSKGHGDDS